MENKKNRQVQQERELTGKESFICMVMMVVVLLLASIEEWVCVGLAIIVGVGTYIYQYKSMRTRSNKEV